MREDRYRWAKIHENSTAEHWKNVISSDDAKLTFFGSDGIHNVRHSSGEMYKTECIMFTVDQSVGRNVWGCSTYDGAKVLTLTVDQSVRW